jgi:hypothetical protein
MVQNRLDPLIHTLKPFRSRLRIRRNTGIRPFSAMGHLHILIFFTALFTSMADTGLKKCKTEIHNFLPHCSFKGMRKNF